MRSRTDKMLLLLLLLAPPLLLLLAQENENLLPYLQSLHARSVLISASIAKLNVRQPQQQQQTVWLSTINRFALLCAQIQQLHDDLLSSPQYEAQRDALSARIVKPLNAAFQPQRQLRSKQIREIEAEQQQLIQAFLQQHQQQQSINSNIDADSQLSLRALMTHVTEYNNRCDECEVMVEHEFALFLKQGDSDTTAVTSTAVKTETAQQQSAAAAAADDALLQRHLMRQFRG